MSLQLKSKVKFSELLKGLEQLTLRELEQLVQTARVLQSKYMSKEADKLDDLMEIAKLKLPKKIESRYDALLNKKNAGTISAKDQLELGKIVDLIEEMDLRKAEALYTISRIKGISGKKLLKLLQQ